MSKKILIITGEASGDLHGAKLIKALKKNSPDIVFFGMGGDKMLEAGCQILYPIGDLSIIGVSGVLLQLKKIKNLFDLLTKKLNEIKPDLVILVDYPGFNLRFAKIVKKVGIPIIYYISPQIWAWGKFRIWEIKKNIRKMLVLFKFEEDLYKEFGVNAEFVGHPLIDSVKVSAPAQKLKEEFGITSERVITLLPGSRESEVKNLLPVMLGSFKKIQSQLKNVKLVIAKYGELSFQVYENILNKFDIDYKLIDGKTYDCIEVSDLVIAASGTATLETAILEKPMIITYKVSFLTGIFFLLFVRIPCIGLVNIVAKKKIAPELLQYSATAERISREAIDILSSPDRLNQMKKELWKVKEILGPPGASQRAARSIAEFLNIV